MFNAVSKRCMAHLITDPFCQRQSAFQNEADLISGIHPNVVHELREKKLVKLRHHAAALCEVEQLLRLCDLRGITVPVAAQGLDFLTEAVSLCQQSIAFAVIENLVNVALCHYQCFYRQFGKFSQS